MHFTEPLYYTGTLRDSSRVLSVQRSLAEAIMREVFYQQTSGGFQDLLSRRGVGGEWLPEEIPLVLAVDAVFNHAPSSGNLEERSGSCQDLLVTQA